MKGVLYRWLRGGKYHHRPKDFLEVLADMLYNETQQIQEFWCCLVFSGISRAHLHQKGRAGGGVLGKQAVGKLEGPALVRVGRRPDGHLNVGQMNSSNQN